MGAVSWCGRSRCRRMADASGRTASPQEDPPQMPLPDERPQLERTRSRRAAAAVVALVVAVGVLVAGVGSLPAACGTCHAMRSYTSTLRSSPHKAVQCYSCHLPSGAWSWPAFKAREVLGMYPAAATGATVTAPAERVPTAACLACHAAELRETVSRGGLRIAHSFCAQGTGCDTCHATVAHGAATRWKRTPEMDACLACHIRRSATLACDGCHASRTQAAWLASAGWRSTHGATWAAEHGKGDLGLCRACHDNAFCTDCHGLTLPHPADFTNVHGGYAQVASARCGDCHDRAAFCDPCHGLAMPHADDYAKTHPATARGVRDARCARCHAQSACGACHKAHTHPTTTKGTLGTFVLPGAKP